MVSCNQHGSEKQFSSSPNGLLEQAMNPDGNICSNSNIKGIKSWIAPSLTILTSSWHAVVLQTMDIVGIQNISNNIMESNVPTFSTSTSTL
jgi:hypothetical protein